MPMSSNLGFGEHNSLHASGLDSDSYSSEDALKSFWDLPALKKAPKSEVGEEIIEGNVIVREIIYEVPASDGKPIKIFAYYAYPAAKKNGKLPAIVWVHGGGSIADRNAVVHWASLGYAALAMDLPGKGGEARAKSRSEGPDMSDPLIFTVAPLPRESYLYLCVNSVCRAISFLQSREEVDSTRIGVLGYSWGGVITLLANGVDDRIAAACAVYGSGYIYEESFWSHGQYAELSFKDKRLWREHFDPSSYLKSLHGKTLFVSATQDIYYPLRGFVKTYREAECAKALYIALNKNHDLDEIGKKTIERWFEWALRSGPVLPSIEVKKTKTGFELSAKEPSQIASVSLAITDSADYAKAEWTSAELKAENGKWKASLSQNNPSALVYACDVLGGAVVEVLRLAPRQNRATN